MLAEIIACGGGRFPRGLKPASSRTLAARLKPRPFKAALAAGLKPRPFKAALAAGLKPRPFKATLAAWLKPRSFKTMFSVGLAFGLVFCGGSLLAQSNDALVSKVDDHYNRLNSLRAHYAEHYSGMGMDRTEEGTLLLKKPGRMRWSYEAPVGKVFVLDGKFAWFYTPGDAQATRVPAKQLDDLRSPLRFLLGHTQLRKELDKLTVAPEGDGFRISGVPKGMEQRVKVLSLWVTPAGAIQQMRLEEVDGAVTEFIFSDLQENVPVKDSDFAFIPPAGVTVVQGLPPI